MVRLESIVVSTLGVLVPEIFNVIYLSTIDLPSALY